MNIREAAQLLSADPKYVKMAIEEGVRLPKSSALKQLAAHKGSSGYEISDQQLQEFIDAFEVDHPGRHPPVDTRRDLRVEAQHKCGICRADSPLSLHHILPWRALSPFLGEHHDPNLMLALCGSCHSKIETGQIDRIEQRRYKRKLQDAHEAREYPSEILPGGPASPLAWDDIANLIDLAHQVLVEDDSKSESQYDFSLLDLKSKNLLNALSSHTYQLMKEDEAFFGRIQEFLGHPRNASIAERYHQVIDELRYRVAGNADRFSKFDYILLQLHTELASRFPDGLGGKRRALRILLHFMYFNCDIGRTT